MKAFKNIFAAMSCALLFASSAQAIPLTVNSNVTNYQLNAQGTNKSVSLNFDINALLTSSSASLSDITSAILTIIFADPNNGSETYTVSVAMNGQTVSPNGSNNVNNGGTKNEPIILNPASLNDLKFDGLVSALVTANTGEFFINSASLTAQVEAGGPGAAIPEPAGMALLGLGLLAVGAARRRRS